MTNDKHALRRVTRVPGTTSAVYACWCGQVGEATRAYEGEDVAAKAKRNHAAHARRAKRKA